VEGLASVPYDRAVFVRLLPTNEQQLLHDRVGGFAAATDPDLGRPAVGDHSAVTSHGGVGEHNAVAERC